jgi:hypothetical protein
MALHKLFKFFQLTLKQVVIIHYQIHDRALSDYSAEFGSSTHATSIVTCVFCGACDVRHSNTYLRNHAKKCAAWIGMDAFNETWKARLAGRQIDLESVLPPRMTPSVALKRRPVLGRMAERTKRTKRRSNAAQGAKTWNTRKRGSVAGNPIVKLFV